MFGRKQPDVPGVSAAEAKALIEEGALLVDVREQHEWNDERIPGAELKPMSTINDWWTELPRDRTVVVQCRTGSRSAQIIAALENQVGFDNLVNLNGGIVAWKFAGLGTES